MREIRKEVIRPGIYFHQDQKTGLPVQFVATPERVKRWHDQGNAMLAAGLSIPLPIGHQLPNPLKPMTAAQREAAEIVGNAGWLKGYELDKDNRLFSVCQIDDDEVAAKIPKGTVKWTSPYFASFTDGDGKKWDDVIAHLAIVSRPRIVNQQPFETIPAAMSYLASTTSRPIEGEFSLSIAGLLDKKDGKLKPTYPAAFSLYSGGIAMAFEDIAEKKEKKEPPKKEGKDEEKGDGGKEGLEKKAKVDADKDGEVESIGEEIEGLIDASGDISVFEVIGDLLAAEGWEMPEVLTADNFAEEMYHACMSRLKSKTEEPEEELLEEPEPPAPKNNRTREKAPIVQEQPPMYMSLTAEKVAAITDPEKKAMAEALFSVQQNLISGAKLTRAARIERILKRRKSAKLAELLTKNSADAAFSLTLDGRVADDMDAMLTALEEGIPDMPVLLGINGAKEIPHLEQPSEDGRTTITEERRKEVVKQQARHGGIEVN